jgi:DNA-binding PadR family transcriptional regulator
MLYSGVYKEIKLGRREQLLLLEIDKDHIDTASSFVDYIREGYGFSKSSIWYCLNRLKEFGLIEFATKEEIGKPLKLTRNGLAQLAKLEASRNQVMAQFSNSYLESINRNASYLENGAYALYR